MNRIKSLKDGVQRAIEHATASVEAAYLRAARVPFERLARIDLLEDTVRRVQSAHDTHVGKVYGAIRAMNRRLGGLADRALARLGMAPPPRRRRRPARRTP